MANNGTLGTDDNRADHDWNRSPRRKRWPVLFKTFRPRASPSRWELTRALSADGSVAISSTRHYIGSYVDNPNREDPTKKLTVTIIAAVNASA